MYKVIYKLIKYLIYTQRVSSIFKASLITRFCVQVILCKVLPGQVDILLLFYLGKSLHHQLHYVSSIYSDVHLFFQWKKYRNPVIVFTHFNILVRNYFLFLGLPREFLKYQKYISINIFNIIFISILNRIISSSQFDCPSY